MAIHARKQEGVQILTLAGEFTVGRHMTRPLDLQGRPVEDLREALVALLEAGEKNIILDLSVVTFIDSAGLGELVACRKRTLERGGDIKLLQPAAKVRQLLVMTLLTQIFEIHEDLGAAIESFRKPPVRPVGR